MMNVYGQFNSCLRSGEENFAASNSGFRKSIKLEGSEPESAEDVGTNFANFKSIFRGSFLPHLLVVSHTQWAQEPKRKEEKKKKTRRETFFGCAPFSPYPCDHKYFTSKGKFINQTSSLLLFGEFCSSAIQKQQEFPFSISFSFFIFSLCTTKTRAKLHARKKAKTLNYLWKWVQNEECFLHLFLRFLLHFFSPLFFRRDEVSGEWRVEKKNSFTGEMRKSQM